jgi:hypothetical protein
MAKVLKQPLIYERMTGNLSSLTKTLPLTSRWSILYIGFCDKPSGGYYRLGPRAKLKLKSRGVLYPAHPGGGDEPLCVQNAITKLELCVGLVKVRRALKASSSES